MVNIGMLKSSVADRKVAPRSRNRNRVREEEQLYLLREATNPQQLIRQVHVAKDGAGNGMRPYVALKTGNGRYGQTQRDLLFQRYADKLIVDSMLTRRVVSFQASKGMPFYRWLKYKEAFSPELVDYLFDVAALPNNASIEILDPFAGTGTALTRAVARKWNATGIELMPVGACSLKARFIADRVSLTSFHRALDGLNEIDWKAADPRWRFRHLAITKSAFPARSEKEMSAYLTWINRLRGPDVQYLFWFAALSVLEEVSFTRKDGQYLRWDYRSGRKLAKHFDKGPVPPFSTAIRQRLREFASDLKHRNGGNFSPHARRYRRFLPFGVTKARRQIGRLDDYVASGPATDMITPARMPSSSRFAVLMRNKFEPCDKRCYLQRWRTRARGVR